MKKKQLLALALVGAMSVGTAAQMAPATTFAAEETKTAKEMLKDAFTKHNVEDIKIADLTDAQVKELLEIIKEVEVLEGKELGVFKTKEKDIKAAFALLKADSYKNNFPNLKHDEMISFRTRKLNVIESVQGKAVKDAENKVASKKAAFEKIEMNDFDAKSEAFKALATAQSELETARKAYMDEMNKLAETINKVEMYSRLDMAISSVKEKFIAAIDNFKASMSLEDAKDAYLNASAMKTKYPKEEDYTKAKTEIAKKVSNSFNALLNKVNSQLKDADKVSETDFTSYLTKDTNVSKVVKTLIENKLTKEEITAHKALVKEASMLETPYVDLTNVTAAEAAYNAAYKVAKEAKKDLDLATSMKLEAVKNLDIAVDSIMSAENFEGYKIKMDAADKVKAKYEEVKKSVRDAKKAVEDAKEKLAEAQAELAKDTENEVLKVKAQTAKTMLESKEKALVAAEKHEVEVKADYERLQNASAELYNSFKKYSEATIKGAGKTELKARKERLMESLKKYNVFAKEFGLSEITVTMNEVAEVGTWYKDANGTWFYRNAKEENMYRNSWAKIDGVWYRFDAEGAMLANKWFKDTNNRWYWLNASGRMAENEWINVNGSWFYAYGNGAIAENEWILVNGTWYYAENGGYVAINKTLNINGVNYSFNASGALK